MKKKILTIIMMLALVLFNVSTTQAEVIRYKKYKNFSYEKYDRWSIEIKQYNGKKSRATIPEKIKGKKVRYVYLEKAKNLKKIKISRYVKDVCLSKNRRLTKVIISKKNKYLSTKNNMVLNKKKTKLISVLGGYEEIKVPKTVKTMETSSFYCSKVKKVEITKNVKKIKTATFDECKKLKEIIFTGDTIPEMAEGAFESCNENISFYVKNDEVAQALLEELGDRFNLNVQIYANNELICEKQIVKAEK